MDHASSSLGWFDDEGFFEIKIKWHSKKSNTPQTIESLSWPLYFCHIQTLGIKYGLYQDSSWLCFQRYFHGLFSSPGVSPVTVDIQVDKAQELV